MGGWVAVAVVECVCVWGGSSAEAAGEIKGDDQNETAKFLCLDGSGP